MFPKTFSHRPRSNDSYDSICTTCFATAAYGKTEEELIVVEKEHVCKRDALERLLKDQAA
jgi:hypothetical protein